MMNRSNLILTTSPPSQPAKKLRVASLPHRQRPLYGRKRHCHTVKERDSETGLYYYGARYLDSKTSRWLSGDPAMGEYVPEAPVSDEARKRNGNLPGMGGVFNYVNLHVYHYAGNNPLKYTDPDGRNDEISHEETDKAFKNWLETSDPKYHQVARDVKMYIENQATMGNRPTDEQITQEAENALLGQAIYAAAGAFAVGLTQMPVSGGSTTDSNTNTLRDTRGGQLTQIFSNRRYFMNWIKGNQSLSRRANPLNLKEAQQLINTANKFDIPIDNNLTGLLGNEVRGTWAGISHFKIGGVHIPITRGIHNGLRF